MKSIFFSIEMVKVFNYLLKLHTQVSVYVL